MKCLGQVRLPANFGGFLPLLDGYHYLWYNIITVREQKESKRRARRYQEETKKRPRRDQEESKRRARKDAVNKP